MGPLGPTLIINLADGQGTLLPLTDEQAVNLGTALIKLAAQHEMLKKMQEAEQAAQEPVPTTPEMESLLAEAQGNTAQHAEIPAEESEPAPNSFDINGRPVYEPPAEETE